MFLAHLGVGVFVLGVAGVNTLADGSRPCGGDRRKLRAWSTALRQGPDARRLHRTTAQLAARSRSHRQGGRTLTLHPEKRRYNAQQAVMTEAAIAVGASWATSTSRSASHWPGWPLDCQGLGQAADRLDLVRMPAHGHRRVHRPLRPALSSGVCSRRAFTRRAGGRGSRSAHHGPQRLMASAFGRTARFAVPALGSSSRLRRSCCWGCFATRRNSSPLIDKAAPAFDSAAAGDDRRRLPTDPGRLSSADLAARPYILNVWASWCAPCLQEHPLLLDLAKRRLAPGGGDRLQGRAGSRPGPGSRAMATRSMRRRQ